MPFALTWIGPFFLRRPPGLPDWPFVTGPAFRSSCLCMEFTGINFHSRVIVLRETVVRSTMRYESGKITDPIPSNKPPRNKNRSHTELASMIVRSFHMTIAATVARLPGDAPPRNDPRGDSTISVPNSERSPQACRGSALSEDASFISYSARHPSAGRITTSATPVWIIP